MFKLINSIEDVVLDDSEDPMADKNCYFESVSLGLQVGILSVPLEIVRAIILPLIDGLWHVGWIISSGLFYGFTGKLRRLSD